MVDTPIPAPRPSKVDALKSAATGPTATVVALAAAFSSLIAAVQTYQQSSATARISYETLKTASETNAARIEVCYQGQLEQRAWIQELSDRLERRAETTDKALTRKVTKARATPVAPIVEPAPKAPPPIDPPEPTNLPPFDSLARAAP